MTGRVEGLVSVVVPVHNRAGLLREAVESALAQSYSRLEVIVVDDASSDDTPEAIEALVRRDPERIRALRQPENRGPGPSREAGRRSARGEFVQYLDSDDLLLPEKLERQVARMRSRPEVGVSYGWTRLRYRDGRLDEQPYKRSGVRFETILPAFLAGRVWNTTTPLYRAAVCDDAGPWSDLWLEEDWEYDCRVGLLGTRLDFVPEWLCVFRSHHQPRLGIGRPLDPRRLREQARAHRLVLGHARSAGISPATPEMASFARSLFLLARRCGSAGLTSDARDLFTLARRTSTPARAGGWDFRLVGTLAAVLGWRLTGRLALGADRLRGSD